MNELSETVDKNSPDGLAAKLDKLAKKEQGETKVLRAVKSALQKLGWTAYRINSQDFPDLYCTHPFYQPRWVEIKVPGAKLRENQVRVFNRLEIENVKIYVMTGPEMANLINENPNWRHYV